MQIIKVRGHEYKLSLITNSFNRRATHMQNMIIEKLRVLGLTPDDIDVSEERVPFKKAPASVSFWYDHCHLHFSYNKMNKFVDNLLVVSKVIDHSINQLVDEKISIQDFVGSFREEDGFDQSRIDARKFFDLDEDHINLDEINKKYKALAKSLHPDMPGGDMEKFKQLNQHHKILKRELE